MADKISPEKYILLQERGSEQLPYNQILLGLLTWTIDNGYRPSSKRTQADGKRGCGKIDHSPGIGPRISDLSALTTELRYVPRQKPASISKLSDGLNRFKAGWTGSKQAGWI